MKITRSKIISEELLSEIPEISGYKMGVALSNNLKYFNNITNGLYSDKIFHINLLGERVKACLSLKEYSPSTKIGEYSLFVTCYDTKERKFGLFRVAFAELLYDGSIEVGSVDKESENTLLSIIPKESVYFKNNAFIPQMYSSKDFNPMRVLYNMNSPFLKRIRKQKELEI